MEAIYSILCSIVRRARVLKGSDAPLIGAHARREDEKVPASLPSRLCSDRPRAPSQAPAAE
jgi:hypothetical protein